MDENTRWKEIAGLSIAGHNAKVFAGADDFLLVAIYEPGKNSGVAFEVSRVFCSAEGLHALAENLNAPSLLITKYLKGAQANYLLLSSGANYAKNAELLFEEAGKTADSMHARASSIKKIAASCDVVLNELGESGRQMQNGFFVSPLLFSSLIGAAGEINPKGRNAFEREIILGKDIKGGIVSEPLQFFSHALICRGTESERNFAVRLLCESLMLHSIPLLILSGNPSFRALSRPRSLDIAAQGIELEFDAMGFPVRLLKLGKHLGINLNSVSSNSLMELFGIKEKSLRKSIDELMRKTSASDVSEIVYSARKKMQELGISSKELNRIIRFFMLMQARYPGLFCAGVDAGELFRGISGIGIASIAEMQNLDARGKLLLYNSAMHSILKSESAENCALILPEAQQALSEARTGDAAQEFAGLVEKLAKKRIFVIMSAENEMDLPKALRAKAHAKIEIIGGRDCALKFENRMPKRIELRNPLSSVD
ncbi:MAG: hypothetical protein HYW05_04765 [Candidatus Diapherotrites archaeon]|nr:hypothetical protein [Candidatus Diapherotrites archaeon]